MLGFSSRLTGVKITVTFCGDRGNHPEGPRSFLWWIYRLRNNSSSPSLESKYPCEDSRTVLRLLILPLVPSFLRTFICLSPWCHLCQDHTSRSRFRVFVLWCCWEIVEIIWDLPCLPSLLSLSLRLFGCCWWSCWLCIWLCDSSAL